EPPSANVTPPAIGAAHAGSHPATTAGCHALPSTVACSCTAALPSLETARARHHLTPVLPPSSDGGKVQAATPRTDVVADRVRPAMGRTTTAPAVAACMRTRTVRVGSVTSEVPG